MASPDGITPEMHDDEAIHATGNEKILFVEDEEAIVKLGVLMLERMGYQVTGQVNSLEALDLFKSAQINLISSSPTCQCHTWSGQTWPKNNGYTPGYSCYYLHRV